MKLNIVLIFGLVCIVAICSAKPATEDDYAEYEDEPAPPPKKTPIKSPLIGRRNPLAGRNNKSSTTAAPAPPEEEVVEEEEIEEEQLEQVSSTTETPKKFIKGGIVRPFRSNDDLLATLKRRREQVANNKHKVHVTEAEESAPTPVHETAKSRPSAAGRRKFNKGETSSTVGSEQGASTAAPVRTNRRFNARS